jgi:2-phosphosulfolactate phosphatase
VNASATAQRIRELSPRHVTLVRMGLEARERTLEDDLCAEWLASLLRGEPYDAQAIPRQLEGSPSARKFFDPACDFAPREDFDICVDLDRFRFALQLEGRQSASPWLAARSVR